MTTIQVEDLDEETEFITVVEAAHRTRVGRNTFYEAIKRNEVPGVKRIGKRIVIHWKTFVEATMTRPKEADQDDTDSKK